MESPWGPSDLGVKDRRKAYRFFCSVFSRQPANYGITFGFVSEKAFFKEFGSDLTLVVKFFVMGQSADKFGNNRAILRTSIANIEVIHLSTLLKRKGEPHLGTASFAMAASFPT